MSLPWVKHPALVEQTGQGRTLIRGEGKGLDVKL
jgi:hypothetical protein